MWEPGKTALLVLIGSTVTAVASRGAVAPPDSDVSTAGTLRVGVHAGAGYDSNLYLNRKAPGDTLMLLGAVLDGDLLPSDEIVLKASYRADLEVYDEESSYGHVAQLLSALGGYRATDLVYVSLRVGAEHAHFPDQPSYAFWGAFAKAAARAEVGDASTLLAAYQLRTDRFAENTLDNVSHSGTLTWQVAAAAALDVQLPLMFEHIRYSERFLMTETGEQTGTARSASRLRVEPGVTLFPTYSMRLDATLKAEINESNDTYASVPFGADPIDAPTEGDGSFVRHYDSYKAAGADVSLRLEPVDPLTVTLRASAGRRQFSKRPAFDANALATRDKQADTWASASAALAWPLGSHFEVTASYGYDRQWSNDSFWDYDRHRGMVTLGGWWQDGD